MSQRLLVVFLIVLLVAVGGVWYVLEGRQLVAAMLQTRSARAGPASHGLPTVELDLGADAYQALERQWREALERGIPPPSEQDGWPAQLSLQDRAVPVHVWVQGEGMDPDRQHKWAFQVTVQDSGALLGMRAFSMRPPDATRCLDEWLYVKALRAAGILAPGYTFARLAVNGQDWGVYALIERPSEHFLASQDRQDGVVLSLQESLFWRQRAALDQVSETYWDLFSDSADLMLQTPLVAQVDAFQALRAQTDPALQDQALTALGLLRAFQSEQLVASQVFDAELMGRYVAHANLWGARHGATWDDERYYYNPLTARLEPIGHERLAPLRGSEHVLDLAQYDDLAVMRAFAREVMRISHPAYLDLLRGSHGEEIERIRGELATEYPLSDLALPWSTLARRQATLTAALHPPQTVHAFQGSPYAADGELELQVSNLLPYPVALHQLRIADRAADLQPAWVAEGDGALLHQEATPSVVLRSAQSTVPAYVTLHVPATVVQDLLPGSASFLSNTLTLVTALIGIEDRIAVEVDRSYPLAWSGSLLPVQPDVETALDRYPFLAPSGLPLTLEIRPGTWHVGGDLVLPDGVSLYATQPTTLTFDQGAVFFATAPLHLRGPAEGAIHLLPRQENWAGLFVLRDESDEASSLASVEISGTRGIQRGGWVATAGVTFYGSSVVLDRCRLSDSTAPDTIHVVRAHVRLVDTTIERASGNAFAGQSVRGQIERCVFHDVMGNAVDVRNSELAVQDVDMARAYDRGLSAGANTVIAVRGLRVSDVGIAIASSDLSYVYAEDVQITRAGMAGLAAYLGQLGYGPGSIQASEVVFTEDQSTHALVQNGSSVTLNGSAVIARELDVDGLYWRQETVPAVRVLNYRLGPHIRLIGHDLQTSVHPPGEPVLFTLYWQALSRPPLSYTIFVHLLDASGQYVTGWDTLPRENTFPTTDWPVQRVIDDVHRLPLPPDLPPGEYQVALGMYDWETGARLPVYDALGDALPDAAIILEQKVRVD